MVTLFQFLLQPSLECVAAIDIADCTSFEAFIDASSDASMHTTEEETSNTPFQHDHHHHHQRSSLAIIYRKFIEISATMARVSLLRLHLLTPPIPVDPASKPATKTALVCLESEVLRGHADVGVSAAALANEAIRGKLTSIHTLRHYAHSLTHSLCLSVCVPLPLSTLYF